MTFGLALLGLIMLAGQAKAQAAGGVDNPLRVEWAQDHSDIAPDPAARFGRLANGLTYMIYKNATPPGTVAIHLRIAGGSLEEDDGQRGLAHFIEHMAFNGSTHIPKDQLLPLLQRHGLKIGPDAGAVTVPTKTEYNFELPDNDPRTIDAAFLVLREIGSELTFDPAAIERERNVILGEERLRDTPQTHAALAWMAAAYPGQKFATRGQPIGEIQIIETAQRQTMVDLYHQLYRPEMATVVVVGDIDPAVMEAKIKARFADWKPVGPPKRVDFGAYHPRGLSTMVYNAADRGLPIQLTATWFKPYDARPQDEQMNLEQVEDLLILDILNRRLHHLTEQPSSALLNGGAARQSVFQTAQVLQLLAVPKPGQDRAAYAEALTGLHQFLTYGVNPDELTEASLQAETFFSSTVSGGKTRTNDAIIENFISNLDQNGVFTSPEKDLADFERFKPLMTRERIDARIKVLFSGDGPLLAQTGMDPTGLNDAGLVQTYQAAMSAPVQPYQAQATKSWPYTDFGPAQKPIAQQDVAALGFRRYTFPNGVVLNVKPTKFKDDQVLVAVTFAGGLEAFSPQTAAPVSFTNLYCHIGGYLAGGLGQLDQEELQRTLAGKTQSVSFAIGEGDSTLGGVTTTTDLAAQLQLLTAFTVDPGYRAAMFDRVHTALPSTYSIITTSPSQLASLVLPELTHAHDRRLAFPALAQAQAITLDQIKGVLQTLTTHVPVQVTLVGDFDEARAVDLVARTFATLPTTPKTSPRPPGGDYTAFPIEGLNRVLYHQGRPDQSLSVIAWPTTDSLSDLQVSRGLELLAEVMNQRAWEQVREKLGQAYDANVALEQSAVFRGYGLIRATGSVAAGQDPAFVAAVQGIVADLQARPISDDELTRARKPLLERWSRAQSDNVFWVNLIPRIADDPAWMEAVRTQSAALERVTPADIQALARTYLIPAKALHVTILPRPSPAGK